MKLQFDNCVFDSDARQLLRDGEKVHISGKAFQLLEMLLKERPNPIPKETIFSRLWPDTFVSEANLASLIKEIRAAIGDDAKSPKFIRTAHRFGYAFEAPVVEMKQEAKPIDSVAVLPFTNASGTPDCDYLADGVTETLINTLASLNLIRVAPRGASFRCRGREGDSAGLRRDLNVRAILTGTLRLVGGDVALQVELTDLATEAQIWGAQFRRPMTDLFALQDELSREVASHLRLRISGETERKLTRRYPSSNEAYQLYLRGRHHWNRRTLEGIERGTFYFQSAIDRDPTFAPAYSGLADCYIALGSRDLLPPAQLYPKAEASARKALELDPTLAEAHASIGAIEELFRWNWTASEKAYEEALRLDPEYLTGRMWFALALAHQGHYRDALSHITIAIDSDPLSFLLNTQGAAICYLSRHYYAAEQFCTKALEINPHYEPAHFSMGLAQQMSGKPDEAAESLRRSFEISKGEPHTTAALGVLEASSGARASALERLRRLESQASTRYVSPVHFALVHIALGDLDSAFAKLDEAVASRSGWLVYLKSEPRFDGARQDDRFVELMARVGLFA